METEYEKPAPGAAESQAVREAMTYDGGRQMGLRPTIAGAVRQMSGRRPPVRPNGIFKHPPTWNQDELDFIADCLKQNIPIYTIANMIHCERHTLANLINAREELKQLKEDKYENLLDEAEYQADRLMKSGNAAIVIHVLNTLGRKRGWAEDAQTGEGNDEGRIVMGLIPDEEVSKADAERAKLQEGMQLSPVNPMQMALTEDAVKKEVDRRMNVVEAEEASVSPSEEESAAEPGMVEMAEQQAMDGYMQYGGMAGGGGAAEDDPWADGANSMFYQ